jgi:tetratricopeptide (TPR) repeat protein
MSNVASQIGAVPQSNHGAALECIERGHQALGALDFAAAISAFQQALELDANLPMAHNNLGWALQCLGDNDSALAHYRKALSLNDGLQLAQINLASLLSTLGLFAEAKPNWLSLVSANPGDRALLDEVITSFLKARDLSNAAIAADQYAMVTRGSRWVRSKAADIPVPEVPSPPPIVSKAKLRHDLEQFAYLRGIGAIGDEFEQVLDGYRTVLRKWHPRGDDARVALEGADKEKIGHVFNRIVHRAPGDRVTEVFSESWSPTSAEDEYLASPLGLVVVDDFLSPSALETLGRFCIESTIWFISRYSHGRLGAFFRDGFNCPLLMQIAEELGGRFPRLLGDKHRLMQMWAFKYNHTQPRTGAHTDFAAVNVNFWLTPEAANNGGGGLIIYNTEAPEDWDFASYNGLRGDKIGNFLAESKAKSTAIPYRANRAIIFNSDLFHTTEAVDFKEGYDNRRVNVTMLFGKREDARALRPDHSVA